MRLYEVLLQRIQNGELDDSQGHSESGQERLVAATDKVLGSESSQATITRAEQYRLFMKWSQRQDRKALPGCQFSDVRTNLVGFAIRRIVDRRTSGPAHSSRA